MPEQKTLTSAELRERLAAKSYSTLRDRAVALDAIAALEAAEDRIRELEALAIANGDGGRTHWYYRDQVAEQQKHIRELEAALRKIADNTAIPWSADIARALLAPPPQATLRDENGQCRSCGAATNEYHAEDCKPKEANDA